MRDGRPVSGSGSREYRPGGGRSRSTKGRLVVYTTWRGKTWDEEKLVPVATYSWKYWAQTSQFVAQQAHRELEDFVGWICGLHCVRL